MGNNNSNVVNSTAIYNAKIANEIRYCGACFNKNISCVKHKCKCIKCGVIYVQRYSLETILYSNLYYCRKCNS